MPPVINVVTEELGLPGLWTVREKTYEFRFHSSHIAKFLGNEMVVATMVEMFTMFLSMQMFYRVLNELQTLMALTTCAHGI